jgi:hypothetical protein
VKVLADFGFDNPKVVEVKGVRVAPKDVMIAMMDQYVPLIESFLAPRKTSPPTG